MTQLIGRSSFAPGDGVHVATVIGGGHVRDPSHVVFTVGRYEFHAVSQPVSKPPPVAAKPFPVFKCVCLPEPCPGFPPPATASAVEIELQPFAERDRIRRHASLVILAVLVARIDRRGERAHRCDVEPAA